MLPSSSNLFSKINLRSNKRKVSQIVKIAQCFATYMISDLPAAIAHVAGPNLAPRFKNT